MNTKPGRYDSLGEESVGFRSADAALDPRPLSFRCNICGRSCVKRLIELGREAPSCDSCGSTVRMRAIIQVLSRELFGQSLSLSEFPNRPDLNGLGMSDWDGYASRIAQKLNYKNTYYHQEPRLDICRIDPKLEGVMDFVISSDVFEHVPPPVSIAFENVHRLLKPGAVLIFSVPYSKDPDTLEHFPQLNNYELVESGGERVLRNVTESGVEQIFENLVFHGGAGETLEMRVFSESSLIREFEHAGFREITIHKAPDYPHGIYWQYDWAIVMSARK